MRICNLTANNSWTVAYVFNAIFNVNHPYIIFKSPQGNYLLLVCCCFLIGHRYYWFLQISLPAILRCMLGLLKACSCTRFSLVVQTKCFFLLSSSSLSYRMCCYMKSLFLVFRKVHLEWIPTENVERKFMKNAHPKMSTNSL